jgi:hypothetical protein
MPVARFPAILAGLALVASFAWVPAGFTQQPDSAAAPEAVYVGSDTCASCHDAQFATYSKYSKKAHSSKSVQIMASDLTEEELRGCYGCHTTGYGKPGGFQSFSATPALANAGCEVCHGPGSAHAESGGDASLIKGKLTMADCESCHSAERVAAFNFKPMLYAGAH